MNEVNQASRTATRLPSEQLRPFVSHYSGCRLENLETGTTRALPSRYISVIVSFDQPIIFQDGRTFDSLVGGMSLHPTYLERKQRIELLHLYLKPLGIHSILGLPCGELVNSAVSLDDIVGREAGFLREKLAGANTWSKRFDIVDSFFTNLLIYRDVSANLSNAWSLLVQNNAVIRVSDLASLVGWSRRHLCEKIGSEFGLSPKDLMRILRFERACAHIKSNPQPLKEIATTSGYFDQAHMSREWNELAGCSPKTWIREELPFLQDYEFPEFV